MPLTEHRWRFYWGEHEDRVDGETVLEKWDFISLPPKLWRGFEVLPDQAGTAWMSAVLDPHDVFTFKDPYWSPYVTRAAEKMGYEADETGKMVRVPGDHEDREREVLERIGSHE